MSAGSCRADPCAAARRKKQDAVGKAKKFGAFSGVFTPSLLAILGVIMFLRLPWIVGQAGLWATLGIILVAHIISISTGLSISSLATDKRVEKGGAYYMISRSLGLPIGGTLGIALFMAFSFSISLYLIGFAESFLSYFGFGLSLQSIRITGSITLLLVAAVTFISTSLAIRIQFLIMAALALSLLSVFIGDHAYTPVQPTWLPASGALPWIVLFAIFFPAVTGFNTGVSMSGDLKNPRRDIPLGTMMAILVGLLIYTVLALFFSYTVDRELLLGDPGVLFTISWVPQLVAAGVFAATLSSALGSILGAPRILQAVAIDRILPGFFSKGYGASKEPRNALIITFLIALAGILIGELNVIARIVSIFFIITYGFLNITYVIESWAGSDFRPSFRIHPVVGIVGALACIVVMIQLDILALIVAAVLLFALFLYLKKKELTLQTGDTWSGVWSSLVKTGLAKLNRVSKLSRNWRPNVMLFSGGEKHRPHLVAMGKALVGKMGVFTNFELTEQPGGDILFGLKQAMPSGSRENGSEPFTRKHLCRDIYEGIDIISRVYGFSGFEPNTVLMGWARNTRHPEKFSTLLANLKRQDYNRLFLSYDKEKGFGNYRQINLWWKGHGRSLTLALALLRFLTSSHEWRTAELRILIINNDNSRTDTLYSLVRQLLDNNRMQAEVKVINNGVEQLPQEKIIAAESRDADLTIMELPEITPRDAAAGIERAKALTDAAGTSLLIGASSNFEEAGLPETPVYKPESGLPDETRPDPEVLNQPIPADREIIVSEVNNIGQTAGRFTRKYYEQGLDRLRTSDSKLFEALSTLTDRTLGRLQKIVDEVSPADHSSALLLLLNDFSFYSQRLVEQIRQERIAHDRKVLEGANEAFLDELRAMINVMPEKLRIKLTPGELRIKKHDRFRTQLYKVRRIIEATLTRKPVTHRVRVTPSARYFLYHQQLKFLHQLMRDFALHSFSEMGEVRKMLTGLHVLIEKIRIDASGSSKALERIKMERNRLNARIGVLESGNREFYFQAGNRLYEGLMGRLHQFSHYLESTGANISSRNFSSYFKEDPPLAEDIRQFAGLWEKNLGLFVNKVMLDFHILALKSRLHAKIRKYHADFATTLEVELIRQIERFDVFAEKISARGHQPPSAAERLDHAGLKGVPVPEIYQGLYAEIGGVVKEMPETLEISPGQLGEKIHDEAFAEADRIVVSFRKTIEYYISAELIDQSIKTTRRAEIRLQDIVSSVRDLVRLLNFSLDNEGKNDESGELAHRQEQQIALITDFRKKIVEKKQHVREVLAEVEKGFETGLNKGFEPLSSSIIGQTSMSVKKRPRNADQKEFGGRIRRQWEKAREATGKRFVDLLYRKSEGQLWISHVEKGEFARHHSNRELLDFVDALTPRPGVTKDLPFYYFSLFSGQSGTGDDFWVGMSEEISECDQAISRFKAGIPGALLISGERSSGKSSLSKKMAEKRFSREQIHSLRAPQGCSADVELFTSKLLESLNAQNASLDDVFRAMPAGKVIIIQDLGLWWERRPGGDAVVRLIQDLIDRFGHKCLFIINVNTHALQLIDQLCGIKSYALTTVYCNPFDARELKKMILLRHHAGGMKLMVNNREEDRMTAWDFARLFNTLFERSYGNPGTATMLWLASVKKITGKTLVMESLSLPDIDVFDRLGKEQMFYVRQLIVNRRLSADKLARNLETPIDQVLAELKGLLRAGVVIEKFEGIYAIRPGLDLYLVDKLKTRKRL